LVNQALQIKFMHQYWLYVSAAYTCRQDWRLAVRNFHLEVYIGIVLEQNSGVIRHLEFWYFLIAPVAAPYYAYGRFFDLLGEKG